MAEPREHLIPDELAGSRVDKAVATILGVSRAQARALVEQGVSLDGEPAGPSDRVPAGSVLAIPEPQAVAGLVPEEVGFGILYEDASLIVVDKPAGVVVHPGSGRSSGTLAAGLLHHFPELEGVGQAGRWGLVHRLDRDTSGVLVVARTPAAYTSLVAMLRRREIKRVYAALVHGVMGSSTGTIEAPIARDPDRPVRRAVHAEGKPARTHYRVIETFADRECSLLEVRLETGRTHQIRVHFASIGHPVVGDTLYAGRRHRLGSPRTFLHASMVELTHPVTGEHLVVTSPLSPDLAAVLDGLGSRWIGESDTVG